MKSRAFVVLAAISLGLLSAPTRADTIFVDVPSCHWATEAINVTAGGAEKIVPARNAALAQNAVQQVFEGLRCGDPKWALKFVIGAPSALEGIVSSKALRSFALKLGAVTINGLNATTTANLEVRYQQGAQLISVKRTAIMRLRANDATGWQVEYASLVGLNLPIFPK
jgi:hypothetical protein